MLHNFWITFALVLCSFFLNTKAQLHNEQTEATVREYVQTIDKQMYPMYETIYALTFGKGQSQYNEKLDLLSNITDAIAVQTKEAQLINLEKIENQDLHKRVRNIRRSAYLYILGGDYFNKFEKLVSAMMETALTPNMCEYKRPTRCNMVYLSDVRNIINNKMDPDELRYYWEEYRRHNENIGYYVFPEFIHVFPEFIEMWKKAANVTGEEPVEFLYNSYSNKLMSSNIKLVMEQLKDFYKEFHALVRYKLNKKFGDSVISKTGPLPHHLFEMITLQAWKKESALEHAYPEKRLPNLLAGMEKEGLDADKILQIAENYYISMGFEPISDDIKQHFEKLPGKTSANVGCRDEVYDQTPKVHMKYCPQAHFHYFLQKHGYLGKIHYAYAKRSLPFSNFNSYNFEDAVGEAIILSAASPDNIVKHGFASETTYTKELDMNRLFRRGVHTMFNIPAYFVHIQLMEDLLNGVTDLDNINVHYWKLMETYAGVEPPFDRNITSFDLPVKFYEDIKLNRLVTKFVTEILGYQLYDSLCKLSYKYGPNADPTAQLHNCNLEGSTIVGQKLTEMMSLGSKKGWRKVLETVTGSVGISAEGILNYYKPLRDFIQEEINYNGIHVGWDKSTRVLDGNIVNLLNDNNNSFAID